MNQFLYDTHVHTCEVSPCAKATAEDTVLSYKKNGYSGIIITDHFVCREKVQVSDEEWEKAVDFLCTGYQKALTIGKAEGIQVFFGWEYTRIPYAGTDLLTYGLNAEWLLHHPEISAMDINEYCDFIRSNGGFISHAHPYREAAYIPMIRLLPRKVDAVEVFNANRTVFENEMAAQYADNYNLLKTAGTDNHLGSNQKKLSGLIFERQLSDIHDFIAEIKKSEARIFSQID